MDIAQFLRGDAGWAVVVIIAIRVYTDLRSGALVFGDTHKKVVQSNERLSEKLESLTSETVKTVESQLEAQRAQKQELMKTINSQQESITVTLRELADKIGGSRNG